MKLKILSWNIWCGTYVDGVIDFLKSAEADIIALQEICEDERGNIARIIADSLGYGYAHAIGMFLPARLLPRYDADDQRIIRFGNAILSKHTIENSRPIELAAEDQRLMIQADISIGDTVLNVSSVHLKHTHQKPSALQDLQAENLLTHIPRTRAIAMGDFNALPDSAPVSNMKRALQEFEGGADTPTWSVYKEGCTTCRIGDVRHKLDYIFATDDIRLSSPTIHESKSSDHLPVSAVIEI